MINAIEMTHYCGTCGNELEATMRMSAKEFNEARIDVVSCKTCERTRSLANQASISEIFDENGKPRRRNAEKKTTVAKAVVHPDPAPIVIEPKRRGRPRKHPLADVAPIVPEHRKRGRPRKADSVLNK